MIRESGLGEARRASDHALLGEEDRPRSTAARTRSAGESLHRHLLTLYSLDGKWVRRFQRRCRRTWTGGCLLSLTSRHLGDDLAVVLLAAAALLFWKWRFAAIAILVIPVYVCEASRRALRALPPHDAIRGVRCLAGRDLPVGALPRTSLTVATIACMSTQSIAQGAGLWWAPVLCWTYVLLLTASRVASGRAFFHQALLSVALGMAMYAPLHAAAFSVNRVLATTRARVLVSLILLLPPAAVFLYKMESNQSRFSGVEHREFMRVLRRIATSEGQPSGPAEAEGTSDRHDDAASVSSRGSHDSDAAWREARTSTLEFFRRAVQEPPPGQRQAAGAADQRGGAQRGRGRGKDAFALLVESMERRATLDAGGVTPSALRA